MFNEHVGAGDNQEDSIPLRNTGGAYPQRDF